MKRYFAPILCIPLMAAGTVSDKQAVQAVLDKMIAGELLPQEILDRQESHPEFPNLDEAIVSVRGCKVQILDPAGKGIYGVQWWCKGLKRKEQPSAMIIYASQGHVTRITTAFVSPGY